MSSHQIQPGTQSQLIYREDRSATRWPLAVQGTVAPIVTIGFIIVMNLPHLAALGILGVFALLWALLMTLNLAYSLPVGIRIDRDGIEFGGMNARDRRRRKDRWPPRRPFHVASQGRAVFSCPWEGVRPLYLITDTQELKPLYQARSQFRKSYDGTATPLGFLRFYSMKAALVIINDWIDAPTAHRPPAADEPPSALHRYPFPRKRLVKLCTSRSQPAERHHKATRKTASPWPTVLL